MGLAGFVIGHGGGLMSHTLPFAQETLDVSEGTMSGFFAIARAVSLLALLFSFVGDRRGRRAPFLAAFLMIPLANLGTAFAPDVGAYVAFQSINRLGVAAAAGLAVVILAEELNPRLRSYGLGVYALAGSMGTGASLILLPLADRSDEAWRLLFGISGIGLLVFPILRRFLRESRAFVKTKRKAPLSAALRGGHGRYLWPLAGIAFFIASFSSVGFNFALERLIDDLEWSTGSALAVVLVASGIGTMGLLVGGRAADLVGRRPTEVLALLVGLGGGLGFYLLDSGWILAPMILIASFGATMLTPALAAHRSELFPTGLRATAGAWIHNAGILGSITGFGIGAAAIDRVGLPTTVALLGIGVIVAAFLVFPLPETRGRDLVRRPQVRSGKPADSDATTPSRRVVPPSAPPSPTTPRRVQPPGEAR